MTITKNHNQKMEKTERNQCCINVIEMKTVNYLYVKNRISDDDDFVDAINVVASDF